MARLRNATSIMIMTVGFTVCPGLGEEAALTSENEKLEKYSFRQPHMGTFFELTLYAKDQITANRAAKAGFDRIRDLDATLSDYKPDSELNRLCRRASGRNPVPVSRDLWDLVKYSKSMSMETGGAFDITIGPLVKLWRAARKSGELPEESIRAESLERVGHHKLSLSDEDRKITLHEAGMQLDLGGVAKGYALDQALAIIREKFGITQALINGGGDVLTGDAPPGRDSWNVAVRNPKPDGEPWIVPLENASLATSGDVHQFAEISGNRYSHIVDPTTGLGLTSQLQVSVIAPTGMEADALASAISVLGIEKGMEFAGSREHCKVLIVFPEKGRARTLSSPGFPLKDR